MNTLSGTRQPTLVEWIACIFVLTFPAMGTFFAPESYFAAQDFTIEGMGEVSVGFPFGRIAYLIIILWLVPVLVTNWQMMLPAFRRSWLPLLFMIWTMITTSWAGDVGLAVNRTFRVLVLVVFAIYLIERFEPKMVLRMILTAGTIAVVCSIFAAIALPAYGLTHLIGYEGAWRGATVHKNTLGGVMCLVFAISYYSFKSRSIDRNWCLFVMLGSVFLVVMARSATSLLNIMLSIALFNILGFINHLRQTSAKIVVMAILVVGAVGIYIGRDVIDLVLAAVGRSSDFTGRADIWEITREMIQERPIFGWGTGFWESDTPTRAAVWDTLGWAPPSSHNTFLDIWFQLGLVGLVIAMTMLGAVLLRTVRILLVGTEEYNLVWALLVTTLIIGGLTESVLVGVGATAMFQFTLAYAGLAKELETSKAAQKRRTAPARRVALPKGALPVRRFGRQL